MFSKRGREEWTKSDENVNPQKLVCNHLLSVINVRRREEERQALDGELQKIQAAGRLNRFGKLVMLKV